MEEYKSISRYLNKNKKQSKGIKRLNTLLLFVVLALGCLIFLKIDNDNKKLVTNFLYSNNISFAKINDWYKKTLGNILPFEKVIPEPVIEVFNETMTYSKLENYNDGIKLSVADKYLVPVLESGIVVFVGDKEGLGKTIIIQQTDEVEVWYSNINNLNVTAYDYVSKGDYLGETIDDKLYLTFYKDGEVVDYKIYLQ